MMGGTHTEGTAEIPLGIDGGGDDEAEASANTKGFSAAAAKMDAPLGPFLPSLSLLRYARLTFPPSSPSPWTFSINFEFEIRAKN